MYLVVLISLIAIGIVVKILWSKPETKPTKCSCNSHVSFGNWLMREMGNKRLITQGDVDRWKEEVEEDVYWPFRRV